MASHFRRGREPHIPPDPRTVTHIPHHIEARSLRGLAQTPRHTFQAAATP